MEYTIYKNFISSVKKYPYRIAILDKTGSEDRVFTYRDLHQEVIKFSSYLFTLNLKKQDRCGIILENSYEYPVVFFSLACLGLVGVPLDPKMGETDIKNIFTDAGCKAICTSEKIFREKEFLKNIEGVEYVMDSSTCHPEERIDEGSSKILLRHKALVDQDDVKEDDLILLLYTSGTTSLPKGVMLTHKNLCSNFNAIKKLKLINKKDVLLSVLPLYHSYPLMATLIVPIFMGAKIVYVKNDWPEKLVDYIKSNNITIFLGVPKIFSKMHSKIMKKLETLSLFKKLILKLFLPRLNNVFGKKFRFFISGGAKLDKNITKDFLELGFKILEGYGLTETSPVVSFNPLNKPKPGSIGKPLDNVEVVIVRSEATKQSNTKDCHASLAMTDKIGEIIVKGPNVMKGYYKDEEKTKLSFKGEWLLTGDLGYIDKDGYIYITGRSKEVIVLSSGKNIYPEEIEKQYLKANSVKEMCVLGIVKGNIEYLHGVIVPDLEFLKKEGEINIERVIKNEFEIISRELTPHLRIMGFTVTSYALPRTLLGKLKRYEIREKYISVILKDEKKEVSYSDEENRLLDTPTAKRLVKCLKDKLDIKKPINPSDSIELDLGIDSLGRVELLCMIENEFNMEFEEEMIAAEIFTVKDLIEKINKSQVTGPKSQVKNKSILWKEILGEELSPALKKKIRLKPYLFDYVLTFFVRGFLKLFFSIFYKLKIEGLENIPKNGPYVLCSNHVSFFDAFVITTSVPFSISMQLFFIGFRKYFIAPIVKNLVKSGRIIPIDASEIIEAMQASMFILKNNKALCIFPEGERSMDGSLKEFKKGIGIIGSELNVPLIPVYIKGAYKAWPRTQKFPKLHPIKITFGKKVLPNDLIKRNVSFNTDDQYDIISKGIREKIKKIKDLC